MRRILLSWHHFPKLKPSRLNFVVYKATFSSLPLVNKADLNTTCSNVADKPQNPDADWTLITRSTAIHDFLLEPEDFDKLTVTKKRDPYSTDYGKPHQMLMYWLPEVQQASMKRYGTPSTLLEEKQRRAKTIPDNRTRVRSRIYGVDAEFAKDLPPRFWGSRRPFTDHQGGKAVATAFSMNLTQFIIKMGAAVYTGSASMFSEAMHSLADCSNQVFQALGILRAERDADAIHPYGYGRERYIYGLFAAIGLTCIGGGGSIYHGFSDLWLYFSSTPHDIYRPHVALVVLGLVFFLELYSCSVATKQVVRQAKIMGTDVWTYIKTGPDPMNVAVMVEDGCGMVCSTTAALGVYATMVTGNPVYDTAGSIVIGCVLLRAGYFLISKNRDALLGRSLSQRRLEDLMLKLQADSVISSVHDVKAVIVGHNSVRFKGEINFNSEAIAKKRLKFDDKTNIVKFFAKHNSLKTVPAVEDFIMREHADQLNAIAEEKQRIELVIRRMLDDFETVFIELELL